LDGKLKLKKLIVFQILKSCRGKKELANLNIINSTVAYQAKHVNTTNKNRTCEINSDKRLIIIDNFIKQKIKHNTRNIFHLYGNKIVISKLFNFIKLKETSLNQKFIEGLKS